MGIIWSRGRKKKSAIETLEKLENDIKELEESRSSLQKNNKKFTKIFLICTIVLYILCGILFYFHFTSTLQWKLLYIVPLAFSPLLFYILKRIISWHYMRMINKNQKRLNEMKKEKKRILDEVMDKETYKVAKEILEKYSREESDNISKINEKMLITSYKPFEDGLTRRNVSGLNSPMPRIPNNNQTRSFNTKLYPVTGQKPSSPNRALQVAPVMQLPAPVLPLQRSYVDKVVEYLIGDGPNNRYALICQQCHSHNGMALKEEFEYIGFKCCYCFFYNPARKIRPEAPKLETQWKDSHETDSDSDSKTSDDNSAVHKTALDNPENIDSTIPEKSENSPKQKIDSIISELSKLTNDSSNIKDDTETTEENIQSNDAEHRDDGEKDESSKDPQNADVCDVPLEKS